MENSIDKSMYFSGDLANDFAPLPDPREAKYELAGRLIDNIRFGEAIRILEALGDYGNSPALLAEARRLKAYLDEQDAKQKAERNRQRHERTRRELLAHRRRVIFWAAVCVAAVAVLIAWM